ncbi:ABC transporter ATP-binding protein [Candidatus Woesearchaeota archaeon]|nr:MAG: ABC transporter ATP-binding protein [Candidatus Woesearchaeota archaeon]
MVALEVENLKKSYGDVEAVKGVSFNVRKGAFFGFIGPNGAGKTTTIRSIVGLTRFEGSIRVFGRDVDRESRKVKASIGLSPQEYNFDRFLTVQEELEYTAGYYGLPWREGRRRAERLLHRFSLWEHRKKLSERLSGGMKRRLIIARALIHDPPLLILDEPTAALDVELRRSLWEELRRINEEGKTIILTSHYLEEVELLCHDVAIIHEGRLLALGKKEKLLADLSCEMLTVETDKPVPSSALKGLRVERVGSKTMIVGKGVHEKAKKILDALERRGIAVLRVETGRENLEHLFLRMTRRGRS